MDDVSADHVIAELIDMGFEFSQVLEAIEVVGPCLHDAVEFILKGSCKNNTGQNVTHGLPLDSYSCSTSQARTLGKRTRSLHNSGKMKQSGIMEHLPPLGGPKKMKPSCAYDVSTSGLERFESKPLEVNETSIRSMNNKMATASESYCVPSVKSQTSLQENGNAELPFYISQNQEIESNWEQKIKIVLQKHFGFSSLKCFQKEAMEAWLANRDCLVLAATGSGKSLCFQIPALLTGKVVVVISPLISLMHDQCLKLAKHGVSACFLGSGQTDSSVEQKAMRGMYGIIYVCPETVLRLIEPLKMLAENRGIALFAIDEVHCVSKWGHDFRPDYRRLSVLRDNFKASNLNSLKNDVPLMALTATATTHVREDILESLQMSKGTKIVLTSFFRPNLRFSVKHSRTSCTSSYHKDLRELIDTYTTKGIVSKKESGIILDDLEDESDSSSRSANGSISDTNRTSMSDFEDFEEDHIDGNDAEACSENKNVVASKGNQLSVEYLEDELDTHQSVDDFDVACGEFYGDDPTQHPDVCESSDTIDPPIKLEERLRVPQGPLGQGPTIIYVPTRKETIRLAEYLCRYGVKAAAYNAKLPKKHLRRVHEDFHQNTLEVVVATIAFGMGIDKSNVRRIIHYGWPQSLEAYYQEAGRAGRDGKLADCTLYADLARIPTLLPSKRSEEQTKRAYKMLSDCFRYGMGTSCCRARTLVNYFGEDFSYEKCLLCDICVDGPPKLQNLKEEADIFLHVLADQGSTNVGNLYCDEAICSEFKKQRFREKPDFKMVISRIREQSQKFAASDQLWWQGLARILEDKGYIREADDLVPRVFIKYPEPTELGLRFLHSAIEQPFYAYPEADMLLSLQNHKSYSTFSEWGRGWADPDIRRQRLQRKKYRRKRTRSKRSSRHHQDLRTARGRITAKLSKQKR